MPYVWIRDPRQIQPSVLARARLDHRLHDRHYHSRHLDRLVVGILRLRRLPVIDWLLLAYIELFRCTPLLVQIILVLLRGCLSCWG